MPNTKPIPTGTRWARDRGLVQMAFPLAEDERRKIHAATRLASQPTTQWLRAVAVAEADRALNGKGGRR